MHGTGAGFDNEQSLNAEILKRCPYFFELEPVMAERSATRAITTEDNVDNSTTDEGSECSERSEGSDNYFNADTDELSVQSKLVYGNGVDDELTNKNEIGNNMNGYEVSLLNKETSDNEYSSENDTDGEASNKNESIQRKRSINRSSSTDTDAMNKIGNNINATPPNRSKNNVSPVPSRQNAVSNASNPLSVQKKAKMKDSLKEDINNITRIKEKQLKHDQEFKRREIQLKERELQISYANHKNLMHMKDKEFEIKDRELKVNEQLMASKNRESIMNEKLLHANINKIKVQTKNAMIDMKANLLRQRKELRDLGVPQDEIDQLLPMDNFKDACEDFS